MGYTHYWTMNEGKKVSRKQLKEAIGVMAQIVSSKSRILAGWDGTGKPIAEDGSINFNGIGDYNRCENFLIDTKWNGDFQFCKTARRPYDVVVVACLAVLNHFVKNVVVTSDGDTDEWKEGIALAKKFVPDIATPKYIRLTKTLA